MAKVNEALLELWEKLLKGRNRVLLGRMGRAQIDGLSGSLHLVNT